MGNAAIPAIAPLPRGMTAVGVFLLFGAVMAFLAGTSLAAPGTCLDRLWMLNPYAYDKLGPIRKPVGVVFLSLSLTLALAGIGWLKRRKWGWQLTVAIIGTQLLGDCTHIFIGRIVQGAVGVAIAAALLFYITRASVRSHFRPKRIVHNTPSEPSQS
jgi:hypothetical protein